MTLALAAAVSVVAPQVLPDAIPFFALWLLAPVVAYIVSRPRSAEAQITTAADKLFLREVARRTWRFFQDFITAEEHWLPPDNFQQTPKPLVASRTSPTNMGMGLLATLAAHDFGFISMKTLVLRLRETLQTMSTLPRFRGHFFNWYDTRTCAPLMPQYVSSVDSGNLLAYLLVLAWRSQ